MSVSTAHGRSPVDRSMRQPAAPGLSTERVLDETEPWKHEIVRMLLALLPFGFAFDFKGEIGGTLAQIVMLVFELFVFTGLFLLGSLRPTRQCRRMLLATGYVTGVGYLIAAYYHVPFDQALRISLPYMLFIMGIWAASIAAGRLRSVWTLFQAMILAGTLSLCFRYYYSTGIMGIEMEDMRYQILSPAICSLLAYVCATFLFMRKLYWPVLVVAAAAVLIVMLSVTRAYVITFGFLVVAVPLVLLRFGPSNSQHSSFLRWRKMGLVVALTGGLIGLLLALWLRPDILTSWMSRLQSERILTRSGDDINMITRIAEAKGIWESVGETQWTMIFGKGFGNTYQWAYEYVGEVSSVSLEMVYGFWAPTWFPAHSPFTYALLFGGIPAVLWQLYAFGLPLREGWGLLRALRTVRNVALLRLAVFSLLSVFFYLSQSITANPFGERLSALFLGCAVGMILSFPKLFSAPDVNNLSGIE